MSCVFKLFTCTVFVAVIPYLVTGQLITQPTSDVLTSQSPQDDCGILSQLFQSTNGLAWKNNTGWVDEVNEQHLSPLPLSQKRLICCGWFGVKCGFNETAVIEIKLMRNLLNGPLPHSIGLLTNLHILDLSHNELSGVIPSSITSLTNLEHLSLFANHLTGGIPSDVGNMYSLQWLYLDSNWLEGQIPTSVSTLTRLKRFDVCYNRLHGPIFKGISNLTNLHSLDFSANRMSGEVPDLSSLTLLESLDLSNNTFTGSIPNNMFENMKSLAYLYLNSNHFTGPLPCSIANLSSLKALYVNDNEFEGKICHGMFDSMPDLKQMQLSFNNFHGPLPDFTHVPQLIYLNLQDNWFTGQVTSIRHITELQKFSVGGNLLSGRMSDALSMFEWMPKLAVLDVSDNNFSDNGGWQIMLPSIGMLNLSHNNLEGSTLEQVELKSPSVLLLNETNLNCPLPKFATTVSVSKTFPKGCSLDYSLLLDECIGVGVIAVIALVFFLFLRCIHPQPRKTLVRQLRFGFFMLKWSVRVFSMVSAIVFLLNCFGDVHERYSNGNTCTNADRRSFFGSFLPVRFESATGIQPPIALVNLTFSQYVDILLETYPERFLAANVLEYRKFCAQFPSCHAVRVRGGATDANLACAFIGHLPPIPIFQNVVYLLISMWALLCILSLKEFAKLLGLIYFRCCQGHSGISDRSPHVGHDFCSSSVFSPLFFIGGKRRFNQATDNLILRRASIKTLLLQCLHGIALHSLPFLLLNVYMTMYFLQTDLSAYALASLPLTVLYIVTTIVRLMVMCCGTLTHHSRRNQRSALSVFSLASRSRNLDEQDFFPLASRSRNLDDQDFDWFFDEDIQKDINMASTSNRLSLSTPLI